MSSYVSAQNGYPKRIVWKTDTLNCYTDKQVLKINQVYLTGQENKELLDTCIVQKYKRDTVIKDLISVKESLLKERKKSEDVNKTASSIIEEQIILTEKQKRKLKWEKVKYKFTKVMLSTVSAITITTTVVLAVKLFK